MKRVCAIALFAFILAGGVASFLSTLATIRRQSAAYRTESAALRAERERLELLRARVEDRLSLLAVRDARPVAATVSSNSPARIEDQLVEVEPSGEAPATWPADPLEIPLLTAGEKEHSDRLRAAMPTLGDGLLLSGDVKELLQSPEWNPTEPGAERRREGRVTEGLG